MARLTIATEALGSVHWGSSELPNIIIQEVQGFEARAYHSLVARTKTVLQYLDPDKAAHFQCVGWWLQSCQAYFEFLISQGVGNVDNFTGVFSAQSIVLLDAENSQICLRSRAGLLFRKCQERWHLECSTGGSHVSILDLAG